ncbi:facilitated trehalose transporter Tret1-like [Pararge aegeria]|uniref:Jg13862 protein n=1 Tax=Pararge aegeria aegeria TaxID=348720 RepID=A0A8S4S4M3_9NEOP|nr:facilitated trehalose transporter Tret1-like [Pararge aegeria]XP_039750951.1 facilitated trehalose transporter Tret1-like [Pararge aegeria]CAH2252051.1 jg13862 [Pararge aegeria aegeria]
MQKEYKKGHTYLQWTFAILSNLTLLTYGLECGWISPTTKILQSEASPTGYPLSDNMVSWIASAMSMSAIFGVSLYSYIADAFGRRIGIILIAVPEAISWIIKLSYSSTTTLIMARFFAGLAAGGCFNIVPMYVKEISQDDMRGVLGTMPMLLQTVGLLIMYIIGAYLSYFTVISIVLGFSIFTTVLLLKAPESPAFLVRREKIKEAIETVAFLRGLEKEDKIVRSIVEGMQKEEEHFKTLPNLSILGIIKEKSWRRGITLIMFSFMFHGLNGSYAIMTYASTILNSTGVKFDISPEIQTLSFPIVIIISTLSLAACVERFGRKPLLMGAYLVSACSMSAIAIMMIMQERGFIVPGWLPVITMMLPVAMYGGGISPLPYIIMTEMFNFQIRARVVGIVVTFGWCMTFILVTIYTPMCNTFGQFSPFVFYSTINFMGFLFTMIFIPETKGKNEEEILQMLTRGNLKLLSSI